MAENQKEQVFGVIDNCIELNQTAKNLRDNKEFDQIEILGEENGISKVIVKQFCQGKINHLVSEDENVRKLCTEVLNNPTAESGDAQTKIAQEHKAFKKKVCSMSPDQIYNMAGNIIFLEATVFHLNQLMRDDELKVLILKDGKTLEGAIQHIMMKVRNKYGQMGDLPVEEFHQLIWDYYRLEPEKAKEAMKKPAAPVHSTRTAAKNNKPKPAPQAGPLQISLF